MSTGDIERRARVIAGACVECGGQASAGCPHCGGTGREPHVERWFWLSFVDPYLPTGEQFLGGCYVRAGSLPLAITTSHALGINPGGEVQVVEIPQTFEEEFDRQVPAEDRHRLLLPEEVER